MPGQDWPQAPHEAGLARSTSQPFAGVPSQSAKPGSQVAMTQVAFGPQVAIAWGNVHATHDGAAGRAGGAGAGDGGSGGAVVGAPAGAASVRPRPSTATTTS